MEILVLAQINKLKSAEAELERTLSTVASGAADEASELSFWSSLLEVRERTQRLERVLEAMAGCGYESAGTQPVLMAA